MQDANTNKGGQSTINKPKFLIYFDHDGKVTRTMEFYVTFGTQHPLSRGYIVVVADNDRIARTATFQVLGPKWFTLYSEIPPLEMCPLGAVGDPIIAAEVL